MKQGKKIEHNSSFFYALWQNKGLLFGIFCVYWLLILVGYLFKEESQPVPPVDVVLVFDTTGSMQDEIDSMVRICRDFSAQLKLTGSHSRIGVVAFGGFDEPGGAIRKIMKFEENANTTRKFLSDFTATGGGREDQILALATAIKLNFRSEAKKIVILITDERIGGSESTSGPITTSAYSVQGIIQELNNKDITGYIVAIPEESYKKIARETGGKFYNISSGKDFSEIIMSIGKEISVSLSR